MSIALLSSRSSSSSFSLGNIKQDLPSHASFEISECRTYHRHSYHFFSSSSSFSSSCYCCCFGSVHADEAPNLLVGTSQPFSHPSSLDFNDNNNNDNVRSPSSSSKWKQFWRKLRAQTRKMDCSKPVRQSDLHYDPLSYAMNFDDRTWMNDESHASLFTPRLIPNTLQPSPPPPSISISPKDIPSF